MKEFFRQKRGSWLSPLMNRWRDLQPERKWMSILVLQNLADWCMYSQGENLFTANLQLNESRMGCICLNHCGLRCLRPRQLFQGWLHGQLRCMAGALQLSRGLLSVLNLIPHRVINKLLLITMWAVKDPFSSLLPTAAFDTVRPRLLLLFTQKLLQDH